MYFVCVKVCVHVPASLNLQVVLSEDGAVLPNGLWVPKGTFVGYSPWTVHRREDLWADAERFQPERFLEGPPKPFTWVPFHGGPRLCIGMDMAVSEARAVLAVLLPRFRFSQRKEYPLAFGPGVVLTVKHGIHVDITPRR